MEWLTVPENFQKYRGVNQSKRTVLSTLSQIFEEMGFNYRSPSVIRNKIDTILQSYVRARDYIRGTGQGNFLVVIDSKDADNNRVLQEKKLEGN
jgi:hypothetical protein